MGLVVLRVGAPRSRSAASRSALADTTIGKVGGSPQIGCETGVFASDDPSYTVPKGGGVITTFSVETIDINKGHLLDFLVRRPAGDDNYTVIGLTGRVRLKGAPTPTGTIVETFSANIAVQAGDILGVWVGPGGLTGCVRPSTSQAGVISTLGVPDPLVGDTVHFSSRDVFDLNESATLASSVGAQPPRPASNSASTVAGGTSAAGSRTRGNA